MDRTKNGDDLKAENWTAADEERLYSERGAKGRENAICKDLRDRCQPRLTSSSHRMSSRNPHEWIDPFLLLACVNSSRTCSMRHPIDLVRTRSFDEAIASRLRPLLSGKICKMMQGKENKHPVG